MDVGRLHNADVHSISFSLCNSTYVYTVRTHMSPGSIIDKLSPQILSSLKSLIYTTATKIEVVMMAGV